MTSQGAITTLGKQYIGGWTPTPSTPVFDSTILGGSSPNPTTSVFGGEQGGPAGVEVTSSACPSPGAAEWDVVMSLLWVAVLVLFVFPY